jgi:glycosyltransferase involved in cell wall biosynthesis
MTDLPKVSIIVPIYNVEKYLKRCMDSLINQTLQDIEIIMVDDESPDNCPIICDEYAKQDRRIKVIHKKNGGLGLARNSGLQVATGKFVAFVDSDDFVDIEMYDVLLRTAEEKKADVAYCGINFYKNERHIISRKEVDKLKVFCGREEVDSFLLDMVGPEPSYKRTVKYLMSVCRSIYAMNIITDRKIKFYSEREFISEDLLFNMDYLSQADLVAMVPKCYYYYNYNPKSLSRSYNSDRFESSLKFMNEIKLRLSVLFKDESLYKFRWMRLFFATSMISPIQQEIRYLSVNTYKTTIQNIKFICTNEEVSEVCEKYPYNKLPVKHKFLFLLIKYKCFHILVVLLKIFIK